MAIVDSRYTDTTPVRCEGCGLECRIMDCAHDYARAWPNDVEPMDFCPNCGNANLIPIEEDLVPV